MVLENPTKPGGNPYGIPARFSFPQPPTYRTVNHNNTAGSSPAFRQRSGMSLVR